MASTLQVANRKPVWTGFTTQFEKGVSAAVALREADIDNPVIKVPLFGIDEDGTTYETSKYGLVSPTKGTMFGVVGPNYSFLDNSEIAAILDNSGLTAKYPVIAAGQTPEGSGVVFILDAGERNVAKDKVHQYFVMAESRTGGTAFRQAFTPLRFACMNTLMSAFNKAFEVMAIHHTRQFESAVNLSANFAKLAIRQQTQTMVTFDEMAKTPVTAATLQDYLAATYPLPNRVAARRDLVASMNILEDPFIAGKLADLNKSYDYWKKQAETKRSFAQGIFESWETDNHRLGGTLWAAYNAVVEAEDFGINRGGMKGVPESAVFGARADAKIMALEAATSLLISR